jgi:hypothetical protein
MLEAVKYECVALYCMVEQSNGIEFNCDDVYIVREGNKVDSHSKLCPHCTEPFETASTKKKKITVLYYSNTYGTQRECDHGHNTEQISFPLEYRCAGLTLHRSTSYVCSFYGFVERRITTVAS